MNTLNRLHEIQDKVNNSERLSFDDGMYLEEHVDLLTLGRMANQVRTRLHGNVAYYNTNIHLNPTNVCVYRCKFCAFRSDLKDEKSYVFNEKMIQERVLDCLLYTSDAADDNRLVLFSVGGGA